MRIIRLIPILALILVCSDVFSEEKVIERQQYQMGTYARVLIYDATNKQADRAFSEIEKLDDLLSDYKPESAISKINREAGKSSVKVSPEVIEILQISKQVAAQTEGDFDPTIGALTIGVYRFGRDGGSKITDTDIERAKSLVNYKELQIEGDSVYLERGGMMLDLGGIGKGYAVDKAVAALKEEGITKGMVSLSGDIRVLGNDVLMGIKDPSADGAIAEFMTGTGDLSISTSGGYERSVTSEGKVYHHLIVPETGKPGADFLSVTVVMESNNTLADAYATSLFVMGNEKALKFLERHPGVGVFIVYPDGKTYYNDVFTELTKDLKTNTE